MAADAPRTTAEERETYLRNTGGDLGVADPDVPFVRRLIAHVDDLVTQNGALAAALREAETELEHLLGPRLGKQWAERIDALLSDQPVDTELERLREALDACCGEEDFRAVRNGWACDACVERVVQLAKWQMGAKPRATLPDEAGK